VSRFDVTNLACAAPLKSRTTTIATVRSGYFAEMVATSLLCTREIRVNRKRFDPSISHRLGPQSAFRQHGNESFNRDRVLRGDSSTLTKRDPVPMNHAD